MRLSEITSGATGSSSIATVNAIMTPPEGQFFGGDPNASIYGKIQSNRKKRKEVDETKILNGAKEWLAGYAKLLKDPLVRNAPKTASSGMLTVYHVSDDANFKLDPNHNPKTGGIGVFYVTTEPESWKETLNRKHVSAYKISTTAIAHQKDYPGRVPLTDWAIEQGYMTREEVKRPSGEIVYELDNTTPMVRPQLTEKGKQLPFYGKKDPMRGGGETFLEYAYLKAHGFSAVESAYSPDGQEIAVFDTSCLKPLKQSSCDSR